MTRPGPTEPDPSSATVAGRATAPAFVGIAGLGLLGGSIALDLVATGVRVLGHDPDPATRAAATGRGIDVVDTAADLAIADLVVVATPTAAVVDTVRRVHEAGAPTITDLASVRSIDALGWSGGAPPPTWVGGHPMAGTERRGFAAAQRGLVVGAPWLLTPHDEVDAASLVATVRLVLALGARPVVVAPDQHDTVVATTSHLPHLLAFALQARAHAQGEGVTALAGPSFRDATRVAASAPPFWADLLDRNRGAVRSALAEVMAWLDAAAHESRDDLEARLAAARREPGPPPARSERTTVALRDVPAALAWLRRVGAAGAVVVGVDDRDRAPALVVEGATDPSDPPPD